MQEQDPTLEEADIEIDAGKYVLIKRERLDHYHKLVARKYGDNLANVIRGDLAVLQEPGDSFFVLRHRDVLAAPSLRAYVNTCLTTVELLTMLTRMLDVTDEQRQMVIRAMRVLVPLADYAAGLADVWEQTPDGHKLPD